MSLGLRLRTGRLYPIKRLRLRILNALGPAKYAAKFVFGAFQNALSIFRKIFSGAIDVKVQHRHCRLIWPGFTPLATLGRAFERERDFSRIC